MSNGTITTLRYALTKNAVRHKAKLLSGLYYRNVDLAFQIAQYILFNINVSKIEFVDIELVESQLEEANVSYAGSEEWSYTLAIYHGLLDTFMLAMSLREGSVKAHISPCIYASSSIIATFVNRYGSDDKYNLNGLSPIVWLFVLISIITIAIYFSFIRNFRQRRSKTFTGTFFDFIWYFISDILQNSNGPGDDDLKCRIVIGAWYLSLSVIMKAFSGNLKSELLLLKSETIDSIDDVLANPHWKPLVFVRTSFFSKMMQNVGNVYDKLIDRVGYIDGWGEGTNIFFEGKAALFYSESNIHNQLYGGRRNLRKNKKLYIGKQKIEWGSAHLLFNKRLPKPLLERLDYLVTRFVETNQIGPKKRFNAFRERELRFPETDHLRLIKPMTLLFLMPAFKIWATGIFLSITVKVLEYLYVIAMRSKENYYW